MDASYSDEYDSELYADIQRYLGEFQLNVLPERSSSPAEAAAAAQAAIATANAPSSSFITVFRKKSLEELKILTQPRSMNIYEHNLETPELDRSDPTKSKSSCGRCRQLKKKCSRELPECSSCQSSDKLCVYIPRKGTSLKSRETSPSNSISASPTSPTKSNSTAIKRSSSTSSQSKKQRSDSMSNSCTSSTTSSPTSIHPSTHRLSTSSYSSLNLKSLNNPIPQLPRVQRNSVSIPMMPILSTFSMPSSSSSTVSALPTLSSSPSSLSSNSASFSSTSSMLSAFHFPPLENVVHLPPIEDLIQGIPSRPGAQRNRYSMPNILEKPSSYIKRDI